MTITNDNYNEDSKTINKTKKHDDDDKEDASAGNNNAAGLIAECYKQVYTVYSIHRAQG